MTISIVKFPNDVLLQKCTPIEDISELESIFQEMVAFVEDEVNEAAGLALPQVGVAKRGFVTRLNGVVQICINPIIREKKGGTITSTEGCLSIPEYSNKVERHGKISVRFRDLDNNIHLRDLKEFEAIVFQHELDHLDGILINKKKNSNNNVKLQKGKKRVG